VSGNGGNRQAGTDGPKCNPFSVKMQVIPDSDEINYAKAKLVSLSVRISQKSGAFLLARFLMREAIEA
jgi:hypothetical protein